MTAVLAPQVGKDFKLHMGDGAANETFYPLEGFRANSCKANQGEIDVTTKDGSRFRKLVAGGIVSIDLSGSGVASDGPMVKNLLYKILTTSGGYKGNFKLVFPDGSSVSGSFFAKGMAFDGPHDKEMTYSLDLSSAGDMTLTQAVPTCTAISPATGGTAGGTAVAITGTNFQFGATVAIGGVACTSVVVVDGSHITAVTGAHSGATVNAVVTNPDSQTGTLSNGYVYA